MRKVWIFFILTFPFLSFASAYPIYDEEYQTSDELELDSHEETVASEFDYWEDEKMAQSAEEESFAYENEEQEKERFIASQKRRRHLDDSKWEPKKERRASKRAGRNSSHTMQEEFSLPQTVKSPRSSIQKNPTARSKIKDARDHTNRPRVVHRNQRINPNVEQIEADAYQEEPVFNDENISTSKTYRSSKMAQSQAYAGKNSERSSKQQGVKSKSQDRKMKRNERRSKSYHPGKRPLTSTSP